MLEAVGRHHRWSRVTASNADSEAESCGVLEESVVGGKGLLAPGRFRGPPQTDEITEGCSGCHETAGSDGIVEALVGVGAK